MPCILYSHGGRLCALAVYVRELTACFQVVIISGVLTKKGGINYLCSLITDPDFFENSGIACSGTRARFTGVSSVRILLPPHVPFLIAISHSC